jgi:3-oxoacyl-(acyl-carrier-protein) synthase
MQTTTIIEVFPAGEGRKPRVVVSVVAISEGFLPGNAGFSEPDPECDIPVFAKTRADARPCVVMSNSFGFGGNNTVLVFAAPEARE